MERERYYKIDDRVSITPTDTDFLDMADGYMKALLQRLMDMKQQDSPLPEEIFNNVIPQDLLDLEQSLSPEKQAIVDKALLKLYNYYRTLGGDK